jgi:biotin synthase-like enzyme
MAATHYHHVRHASPAAMQLAPIAHVCSFRTPSLRNQCKYIRLRCMESAGVGLRDPDEVAALNERLLSTPLPELMSEAAALRDAEHGAVITFSPKVFIPLTRLCRDSCGYCTFARPPVAGTRSYMSMQEVLDVAALGAEQGCTEALFTLGTWWKSVPGAQPQPSP